MLLNFEIKIKNKLITNYKTSFNSTRPNLTLKSLNCYKYLTYFMVFMLFSNTAECCNYEQIINANVMSQLLKSRQLQGGFAPLTP